ncbi:DUF1028 domain-containing protein [uncultured Devosia sp.]|uniref:DUF1028 domain-containing protein n=1 Tax=uncultured Devosia sp. TaxID=211434 RepID=UPI002629F4B2|nr:DUF1028 domain-containing protein [uncultured Devosia sp.]
MTFSIVARDPTTGALGVATATAGAAVGALVPHGLAGVGAVATQAMTNPYLAYDALDLLQSGTTLDVALAEALARDPTPEKRQFIIVDRSGATTAWTGEACQGVAGHRQGQDFAVAGNLIANEQVLDRMAKAFEDARKLGRLSDRLLATLEAGADAGGDSRGVGSAALKVFQDERYPLVDLRIDRSDNVMLDLRALHAETTSGGYADFFRQVPGRS